MNQSKRINYSDWLGMSASGLCAIHCAITPLLFAAKPALTSTLGEHAHGHGWWSFLDYLFLAVSFLAVWYSARHTTHVTLKWVLWAAWGVFAVGLLLEQFEMTFGQWLMYAGSFALVIGHMKNYQHCQNCIVEPSN